jgi:hypothetical protein
MNFTAVGQDNEPHVIMTPVPFHSPSHRQNEGRRCRQEPEPFGPQSVSVCRVISRVLALTRVFRRSDAPAPKLGANDVLVDVYCS